MKERKIVINVCYGGFGLSPRAMARLAELKGHECYFFSRTFNGYKHGKYKKLTVEAAEKTGLFWSAFKTPEPPISGDNWHEMSEDERVAWNKAYSEVAFNARDIERDDPLLIQVVEELGEKASDRLSKLKVVSIPADVQWEIAEYDGYEHISEVHRTWD